MKLDKYKFARLVQFISQHRDGEWLDLEELDSLVDVEAPAAPAPTVNINAEALNVLLSAIHQDKKIEAIKAYRLITEMWLKESKDTIEAYWPHDKSRELERQLRRIADALGTAEIGEALIEVARNAHKAEQELGAMKRYQEALDKETGKFGL